MFASTECNIQKGTQVQVSLTEVFENHQQAKMYFEILVREPNT